VQATQQHAKTYVYFHRFPNRCYAADRSQMDGGNWTLSSNSTNYQYCLLVGIWCFLIQHVGEVLPETPAGPSKRVDIIDPAISNIYITATTTPCLVPGTPMVLVPQGPLEPGLISGFQGRQPAGDVRHKPSSRPSLLSARPAVTFPVSELHCPWLVPIYTTL